MGRKKSKKKRGQHPVPRPEDVPTETLRALAEQVNLPPTQATYESLRLQLQYSGPIPPPFMMDAFNQVIPNGADRIMTMAERQSEHRQRLESRVVGGNSRNETLGIVAATVISLAIIGLGGYLATTGQSLVGLGFVVADLVGLAGVYIMGRQRSIRNLTDKGAERE